jgi:thioredoxin 1
LLSAEALLIRRFIIKLLKFEADWCQPCKAMTQIMKGMEYTNVNVDSEEGRALAKEYDIRSLPTLVLVDERGTIIRSTSGLKTREWLQQWVS